MLHPQRPWPSVSIFIAATVRLARSWADLYRYRPFLPYFTAAIHLKRLRPLHLGRIAVVGDFPCLVGVPHRSGRLTRAAYISLDAGERAEVWKGQ
jgi:hypothetical protein